MRSNSKNYQFTHHSNETFLLVDSQNAQGKGLRRVKDISISEKVNEPYNPRFWPHGRQNPDTI